MIWAGHVACITAKMNAYRILMGKPEGKKPLARPRSRLAYEIEIDLREKGCRMEAWTGLI
jgi:hypothetical protein